MPGKVAQFDRFLLSQGTGMASLVMTALQMDGKSGSQGAGVSLSGGLTNEPEGLENSFLWLGLIFSFCFNRCT